MNINGNEYSWASLRALFAGAELAGAKAISYSDEIEGRDPVHGARRVPQGRTAGRYKVGDCSMTLYRSEWQRLLASLPSGYADVEGEIVVQYAEGDDIYEDVLERVRLGGVDSKAEEGTDASEVEVKLSVLRIKWDGKYAIEEAP